MFEHFAKLGVLRDGDLSGLQLVLSSLDPRVDLKLLVPARVCVAASISRCSSVVCLQLMQILADKVLEVLQSGRLTKDSKEQEAALEVR